MQQEHPHLIAKRGRGLTALRGSCSAILIKAFNPSTERVCRSIWPELSRKSGGAMHPIVKLSAKTRIAGGCLVTLRGRGPITSRGRGPITSRGSCRDARKTQRPQAPRD